MKKLSKILALALAVMMLMSVPAFAATLTEGDAHSITLSYEYLDGESWEPVENGIAAGNTFIWLLNFEGNPSTRAESLQSYNLCIAYDAEKMGFDDPVNGYEEYETAPTLNGEFADGIAYAGWSKSGGLYSKGKVITEGTLFGLYFTAKADLTMDDLAAITLVESATSPTSGTTQTTKFSDGSTPKKAIGIVIPDAPEAPEFTPETVKGAVVEGDDANIVLEKDPATAYKNEYTNVAKFEATLGADVKYGEAGFIWVKDDTETANKFTVDASVIAGGGTFEYAVAMYAIPAGVDIDAIPYYVTAE